MQGYSTGAAGLALGERDKPEVPLVIGISRLGSAWPSSARQEHPAGAGLHTGVFQAKRSGMPMGIR